MAHIATVARRAVSQASEDLRQRLSSELAETTAALAKVKHGRDLKGIRARAECLEPLARTAKIVHDWGNTSASGIVVMGGLPDIEPAIEVGPTPQALVGPRPSDEPKA